MRFLLALVLVLVALPATAFADDLQEARDAFTDGAELAKEGRWIDAMAAFRRSAALKPHATTTYNLGYCHLMQGELVRARRLFRQAVREDEQNVGNMSEQLRASTREHLDAIEPRIARVTIRLPDDDVTLLVDERPLEFEASGPPPVLVGGTRDPGPAERVPAATIEVLLDPGPHRFVTGRPGTTKEVSRSRTVDKGTGVVIELDAPPPPEPAIATPADPGLPAGYVGAIVSTSFGNSFLIAGAILAGVAASTWSDAEAACPEPAFCPNNEGPELSEDARMLANAATASFVVGGAALGAGIILWIVTATTKGPEEARMGRLQLSW